MRFLLQMGAYHTIDLEVNRKFTIIKSEWDSVSLDRIQESCDPSKNADVAAVIMQEGLAHVCLVLSAMTLVKAKIETNIPRKRKGVGSGHDKGLEKFFERVVQAIVQHINFDGNFFIKPYFFQGFNYNDSFHAFSVVKAVIIASPGFVRVSK